MVVTVRSAIGSRESQTDSNVRMIGMRRITNFNIHERRMSLRLPNLHCLIQIVTVVLAVCAATHGDDEAKTQDTAIGKAEKLRRNTYVRTMQAVAGGFKVVREPDDGKSECKMSKASILNWTDHARHPELIMPGTTWIWHNHGRPQIIGEIYGRTESVGHWNFFACTVSGDRLTLSDGSTKRSTKQNYDPKEIPRSSGVAKTRTARFLQMGRLARRFDGHQFWEGRFELRLLPQPIYRYENRAAGIIDGAVYALVHGTNPEVLLLIEANARDDGPARWTVCFGSLAAARCVVRLDGEEFWTCPLHGTDPADPRHSFNKNLPVVDNGHRRLK